MDQTHDVKPEFDIFISHAPEDKDGFPAISRTRLKPDGCGRGMTSSRRFYGATDVESPEQRAPQIAVSRRSQGWVTSYWPGTVGSLLGWFSGWPLG